MIDELGELGGLMASECQDTSWRGWKASISYLKILVAFKGLHAIDPSVPPKSKSQISLEVLIQGLSLD